MSICAIIATHARTHARTHGIGLTVFAAENIITRIMQGRTAPVDLHGCSAAFCAFESAV